MNNPLSQFFDDLNNEEREFIPLLESDKFGLILKSALNELDWYSYNLSKTDNPTFEQSEEFYLMQLGVSRLIKLALEARPSFDAPTVMFCRKADKALAVLQIIAGLGMIEHGRRIAQSVSSGLCEIERTGEKEYKINLPSTISDDEYSETAVSRHYRNQSRQWFAEIMQSEFARKHQVEVDKKLTELVYPFQTHYIGYDADPLLDQYFFSLAYHEIQLHEGYDTFNYATRFGGIQFQKYTLTLIFFISIFTRHERFAEALVRKEPTVRLENILTISSDVSGFVESIKDAVNYFGSVYENFEEVTLAEARKIFEVLSYSRKNTSLLDRPGSPLPLIIQNSDQGCYKLLTGAHASPMQFLLDSLRYHFPGDYDKHQQSREKSMQIAVKRVLDEGFAGLEYFKNIKIRIGGRVLTDIDLVVTEKGTGTVLLCQLKHQELYGFDLHAKHIRTSRLKEQVSRWLISLKSWMDEVGEIGLRTSLGLSKKFPALSVYYLVISRHYAYPLKELAQDPKTAYANWNQFFNAIELVKSETLDGRKLEELISMLKNPKAVGGKTEFEAEPTTEWVIRDLRFVVKQAEPE